MVNLSNSHLSVGQVSYQYHDSIAKDAIIQQTPSANLQIAQGTPVDLSISLGPQPQIPPDPASVAPALNPNLILPLSEATKFLYSGSNPIQTGMSPGTIELKRAAVIRGKVLAVDNSPLVGVTITVKDHPEFGQTLSRADGQFDLAVNGGAQLILNYQKAGFLPVQRRVETSWQVYAHSESVIMLEPDAKATRIDLSDNSKAFQIAQSSISTDADGSRQAVLALPQGTTASMTLADGSSEPLTYLTVRATEYTVGKDGPNRMPGLLPPASGYTYAVELSVDEALTAGAKSVNFNQKVPFYVDNFLNFPIGEVVPVGFYDRDKALWVPAPNGKVIKILGISNSQADIDSNGDGLADNTTLLNALNISDAERSQLAQLYPVGKSLWRVQMDHLTPWDCNWPFGPPKDAKDPMQNDPSNPNNDKELKQPQSDNDKNPDNELTCEQGCFIQVENQSLGEDFPITGTEFSLHYRSDRVSGRTTDRTLTIPISGAVLPASLKGIKLTVNIAGQTFIENFPPVPNQNKTFVWNGLDVYGRKNNMATATIKLEYLYTPVYYTSPTDFEASFALSGVTPTSIKRSDDYSSISTSITWKKSLSQNKLPENTGIGNISVNVHHSYDFINNVINKGNQSSFIPRDNLIKNIDRNIDTSAGIGVSGISPDNILAKTAVITPEDVAVDQQGNIYFTEPTNHRIRKINPQGILTTVAGNGNAGFSEDGTLAINAQLNSPKDVEVDGVGNIYFIDDWRIRKISPDGLIFTLAGNGVEGRGYSWCQAPYPLTTAAIKPISIAADLQGNVYFAEYFYSGYGHVCKITPNGILVNVAGKDYSYSTNDGVPAINAMFTQQGPLHISVDKGGNLYILDTPASKIFKVSSSGIITRLLGQGLGDPYFGQYYFPRVSEILAKLLTIRFDDSYLANDSIGNVYFGSFEKLYRIDTHGIVTLLAGSPVAGYSGDGGPAINAQLSRYFRGITVAPDGNIYIADSGNYRIRKLYATLYENVGSIFASEDGTELYVFDNAGRHSETRNAVNNAMLYRFDYESHGLLNTITDSNNRVTKIERLADGRATSIIAPDGERTQLMLDGDGNLIQITDPAGNAHKMTYLPGGLLDTFTDPNGNYYDYAYDVVGRLLDDQSPTGAGLQLTIAEETNTTRTVNKISKLGRVTAFKTEKFVNGDQKRTRTNPNGTLNTTLNQADGTSLDTTADGTKTERKTGPDPRFGMQTPLPVSTKISLPSGLTSIVTLNRAAMLANPQDPLSLSRQTDTLTRNGNVTTQVYDVPTRTLTRTSAAKRVSSAQFDAQDRLRQSQIPALNPISRDYDDQGRLIRITSGTGADLREKVYSYYADGPMKGYLESVTDALGQTRRYQYDPVGRIIQRSEADGRVSNFSYDANGNLTRLIPPERPAHEYRYDGLDQVIHYRPPMLNDLIDPSTRYSYNQDRQITLITRPDEQSITPEYHATGGQLMRLMTAQGTLNYRYLATSGQLSGITTPDGQSLDYRYDGALLKKVQWTGAINGSLDWVYNNDFKVTGQTVNGANGVNYNYDADQLLIQAGNLSLTRAPQNGIVTGTALGSQTTRQSISPFGELQASSAAYNSLDQITFDYQRDKLGRIVGKTETLAGIINTEAYRYDSSGKLIEVSRNGQVLDTYTYDANDNRVQHNGVTVGKYDDQDRLLNYDGTTYSYTANGERQNKTDANGTTGYQYDVFGNLRQVTLPNQNVIEYLIDGQNRRIGKKVNGNLTQGFLYQDSLHPSAELDANNQIVSRFVYGDKANVAAYFIKNGITYRIVSDHLGSPRLIVNTADGSIVQTISYDVWGNVTQDSNPGFQPFGFAGGLYDPDTQLVRFGARDYDPEVGRWTAKDPIGFLGQSNNLYSYVLLDPINNFDPLGLSIQSAGLCLADSTPKCNRQ